MFAPAFRLPRIGQEACVRVPLSDAEVNFELERTKATQSVALAMTHSEFFFFFFIFFNTTTYPEQEVLL